MRARVLAIALVAVVLGAILIPTGLKNRDDFLVSAAVGLAAFLPVAAFAATRAYRPIAFVWVTAVALLGFYFLPLTLIALIGLLVGTAFAAADGRSTARWLIGALAIGVAATTAYVLAVVPDPPASAFVCFDSAAPPAETNAAFNAVVNLSSIQTVARTSYGVRVDFGARATESEVKTAVRALRRSSPHVVEVLRRDHC